MLYIATRTFNNKANYTTILVNGKNDNELFEGIDINSKEIKKSITVIFHKKGILENFDLTTELQKLINDFLEPKGL